MLNPVGCGKRLKGALHTALTRAEGEREGRTRPRLAIGKQGAPALAGRRR
jgi:hypothetical protein